jgi:hypothetical protein
MLRAIPPLLQYIFMAWCLVKHRATLPYLTLYGNKYLSNKTFAFYFFTTLKGSTGNVACVPYSRHSDALNRVNAHDLYCVWSRIILKSDGGI